MSIVMVSLFISRR